MSTQSERIEGGLSFLFDEDARPDSAALRAALERGQARAEIVRDDGEGGCEIAASGLVFEVDGLRPAQSDGQSGSAVRLYPAHHLSGGVKLVPVIRTMLALAAELAEALPVRAVVWHPAGREVAPPIFSRSVLAWLAGGAFPASVLTDLSELADGSLVTRGLAHFGGQEMTLRSPAEADPAERLSLAGHLVDRIVRDGPPAAYTEWTIRNHVLRAEPAPQAGRILVWPA